MNIVILASIGSQNLGDELILKNEIKILEERYSKQMNLLKENINFIVFTYEQEDNFYTAENVKYREYFPIGMKNPKNIFRNIKNFIIFLKEIIKTDLVVIGGGGIFYDSENQSVGSPLKQWLFRVRVAKLFKKQIEIFRVSIDIKYKKNLLIIKDIFTNIDTVSVRDNYSFELLKGLSIIKNVSIIKDPVFFDNYNGEENTEDEYLINTLNKTFLTDCLQSKNLNIDNFKNIIDINDISGKTFGISLRKMNIDNYFENILSVLNYIVDNNGSIIFIPHSFHKTDEVANDYIFQNELYSELGKKYNTQISNKKLQISICKNLEESYGMYKSKKIDINLAQRLHSIILSQVYGINFIGISYSQKTDEVLKQLKKNLPN
ncbi:polysaccharide pyruvyl transferase family protein [Candidatus Gracilibacteria bacterium]|nr:polysaccharide pyruvyl transferase family protein [Candidatus Gracilibacteria bacterium]